MNVLVWKRVKVRSYEVGLHFRDGEFVGLLGEGRHWLVDPLDKSRIEVVSRRNPWLVHSELDMMVRSARLEGHAEVIDLRDEQRALVWIDGRFDQILGPGLYAYWLGQRDVKVEVVETSAVRFEHEELALITRSASARAVVTAGSSGEDSCGSSLVNSTPVTIQPSSSERTYNPAGPR